MVSDTHIRVYSLAVKCASVTSCRQCAPVRNVYVRPCGTDKMTVVGASIHDMLHFDNEGYNYDSNAVTA